VNRDGLTVWFFIDSTDDGGIILFGTQDILSALWRIALRGSLVAATLPAVFGLLAVFIDTNPSMI